MKKIVITILVAVLAFGGFMMLDANEEIIADTKMPAADAPEELETSDEAASEEEKIITKRDTSPISSYAVG